MKKHIAYICVGSNVGNKLEYCQKGIAALVRSGSTEIQAQSRIYKTDPVDYQQQDWFVNYAVKAATVLDPFQLLSELKSIQRQIGRVRDPIRFGPRTLDMDIILYDDIVINSPKLIVPHPRMHKRRFVLKPICDIDPRMIHPVLKKNMQYLLDHLDTEGQGVEPYS
ncbi:MAG: 2-amino-4-hydroxy-6-hydroxymethyldihydropteridine diphosphokinase [Deltaproteobacteria bacterium]|nr:MAG: 2-amino-4-hydroxy-6-hydroxymethyldihydropteridine diphosphokinase [Deltaproteobacteria bacterium]